MAHAENAQTLQSQTLSSMEIEAENLVDTLLSHDIKTSRFHYSQLSTFMRKLEAANTGAAYSEKLSRELMMTYSWLRIIDIETRKQSWVEAAIGANQLTGMIIQATNFPTMMKRDLEWLDYLGREIQLLVLEDKEPNADLLQLRKTNMTSAWERVRDELIQNFKNKPLVLEGNALMAEINQTSNSAALMSKSKAWLSFLKTIEQQ